MAIWNRVLAIIVVNIWGLAAQADTLRLIGTFEWPSASVIGLSGLEVSDDGQTFYAISDRGWFLSGTLLRDGDVITGVDLQTYLPILDSNGLPVPARRVGDLSDSEGLAVAPDGTIWVSFERWARVARYATMTSPAGWIEDHPSFADYADNRQLEALALSPDGVPYTFAEKPQAAGFAVYRLDDDGWTIVGHIPRRDRFAIVGADFDADGRLYLLERKLVIGLWWQSRVRRVDVETLEAPEILWTSDRGDFDNIEGIAVWEDATGPRLTMVSDDNGNSNEPTQFVEFRIED